ncbi:OLC1v1020795C1 [Oldenlandia corymbosa var. corymbosa]|uniref:OLC1v1020795C1 n=1 Tax=Oldenlandia corymbosa var. corymbosa TaxID=529605 RepID=A0AAV1BVQ2_OLDCO|nr:OLC1v1020795C1 [Oldenlandia corymbosa var. corymbosa]
MENNNQSEIGVGESTQPPSVGEDDEEKSKLKCRSKLEELLSDDSLPRTRRLRRAARMELKTLLRILVPACIVYLLNNVTSTSTQVFCGHLGNRELAAAVLGNNGIQNLAFGLMAFSGLWDFFKLSSSSAVMICLELWHLQILILIAGLLPEPEVALDTLAICLTIIGLVFMISAGFNAAASVRISNELGAGNSKSAAFAVIIVTSTSLMIALVIAIFVVAYRHILSYAFTGGKHVAAATSDLTPLLAVSIILFGVQPVLSGVAVGCGWQSFVAYVNIGCYYLVGVPLASILAFKFRLGAKVEKARKRLDKWKDEADESSGK